MWSKAVEFLKNNEVLAAPGCPSFSCMVTSKSKHKIVLNEDGQFECDNERPNFLQHYIFAHTIAAAEYDQLLKEFIISYCKFVKTRKGQQNTSSNFTSLSMTNLLLEEKEISHLLKKQWLEGSQCPMNSGFRY